MVIRLSMNPHACCLVIEQVMVIGGDHDGPVRDRTQRNWARLMGLGKATVVTDTSLSLVGMAFVLEVGRTAESMTEICLMG